MSSALEVEALARHHQGDVPIKLKAQGFHA